MNLHYISDNKGKITGVFIHIRDWTYLKNKYSKIEQEDTFEYKVPERHKKILSQRLNNYPNNSENVLDWDNVQKEIEGEYGF